MKHRVQRVAGSCGALNTVRLLEFQADSGCK